MRFDDILHEIGDFGPYQRRNYAIICIMIIPASWATLLQVFAMGTSDHWCKVPNWNDTACENLGYDVESCDLSIKKLVNIPLENSNVSDTGELEFQKCARYNISDYTRLPLFVNESSQVVYRDVQSSGRSRDVIPCDAGWEHDKSRFTSSLVYEFDLVCDDDKYIQFPQSFYYAGFLVGSFVFGALADAYGRYRMLFLAIAINLSAGFGTAVIHSYWGYAILRFFQGLGSMATYILAYVVGTEFVGTSKRNISGILINIPYAIGYMLMAGIAYLIRDWRMLAIALNVPICLFFLFMLVLTESPRWLISQGETEKAKKIILKAAEVNKVKLPDNILDENIPLEKEEKIQPKKKPNACDVFRNPNMCKRTFNLMYHWMVCTIVYHGFNLSTSSLGIDLYVSFFVSAAIEIPAYTLTIFCIEWPWMGRKKATSLSMLIGGVACLITIFIAPGPLRAGIALVGKFGISMGFAIVYLYTAELYPTPLRTVGMGLCSMAGRVAGIIAPLVLLTAKYWEPCPILIFGTSTVLAGLLTWLLPETLGKKLPETIEDGEKFGRTPPTERKDMSV